MGNRAVEVRGGVVGLASGLLLVSYLHHPPPASTSLHHPDIHAEYVKYPSGKDTITAYLDRKSTRLNSSHRCISYAVFCLKKKSRHSLALALALALAQRERVVLESLTTLHACLPDRTRRWGCRRILDRVCSGVAAITLVAY